MLIRVKHLFVEAYIGVRWVVLDVTWDSASCTGHLSCQRVGWTELTSERQLPRYNWCIQQRKSANSEHNSSDRKSFEKDLTDSGLFYRALQRMATIDAERIRNWGVTIDFRNMCHNQFFLGLPGARCD